MKFQQVKHSMIETANTLSNAKQDYEVVVVGGGFAGSCAAVFLDQQNIRSALIDPSKILPKDFRCEKFNREQMATLERLGVARAIEKNCTPLDDIWIARKGRLLNKMKYPHYGFSYETAVQAIRDQVGDNTDLVNSKVTQIEDMGDHQKLTLVDGSEIRSRLVVLANGLNPKLDNQLGTTRTMMSKEHELVLGFDIRPSQGNAFRFDSLTFWPERASEKLAYFTIFRYVDGYRVNTFGYWEKHDPFIHQCKSAPIAALEKLMPSLRGMIGGFEVEGRVQVRPVDIYQNHPARSSGVVLVGDAYSTSCPGAGTGTTKALNDVEILCNKYIPEWLNSDNINASMIEAFYQDEEKCKIDQDSFDQAFFLKSISMEKDTKWMARRWIRFFYHLGMGTLGNLSDMVRASGKERSA